MQDPISKSLEQAALFQRLWMDSATKMTGVFSQFSPISPPVEEARKLRDGMLKVLGESCEEFMRTPQFMEVVKTSINAALDLQRFSREGMDRIHDHLQTPDKEDIDGVLLAIRHVERRVLDRLEAMDERVGDIDEQVGRVNDRIKKFESASKPHNSGGEEAAPRKRATGSKAKRTTAPKDKRTIAGAYQRSAVRKPNTYR
ncbi:MAG: hypothetical protein WCP06_00205 [Verrucomicrobiota bacterium]